MNIPTTCQVLEFEALAVTVTVVLDIAQEADDVVAEMFSATQLNVPENGAVKVQVVAADIEQALAYGVASVEIVSVLPLIEQARFMGLGVDLSST